jgi:hypothetical protein
MCTQVFVDKDVTAFDHYLADPDCPHDPGFANGIQAAKVVEHWDIVHNAPSTSANGMF